MSGWEKSLVGIDADIVFFGDSITCGGNWNEYFNDYKVCNLSVPGESIEGLRNRVNLVETVNPEKIFILAGVNNLSRLNWEETLESEYDILLNELENIGVEIYVQSIFPVREPSKVSNERIIEANDILRELAAEHGCIFIDLYSALADSNGKLIEKYSKDGVHLKEEAYEIWVDEIREYVED